MRNPRTIYTAESLLRRLRDAAHSLEIACILVLAKKGERPLVFSKFDLADVVDRLTEVDNSSWLLQGSKAWQDVADSLEEAEDDLQVRSLGPCATDEPSGGNR